MRLWLRGSLPVSEEEACHVWSTRLRAVERTLGAELARLRQAGVHAPVEINPPLWGVAELDHLALTMMSAPWMLHVSARTWESLFVCLAWSQPNQSPQRHGIEAIVNLAGGPTSTTAFRRLAHLKRKPSCLLPTMEREFQGWRFAFARHPKEVSQRLATRLEGGSTPFWDLLCTAGMLKISLGLPFQAGLAGRWSIKDAQTIVDCAQSYDWCLWERLLGNIVLGDAPGTKQATRCPPGLARFFAMGLSRGWEPDAEFEGRLGMGRAGVRAAWEHALRHDRASRLSQAWAPSSSLPVVLPSLRL